MNKSEFSTIENIMKQYCSDSAHDNQHIYRVLFAAMEIAKYEQNVDHDILIASCLLHDIAREKQFKNPQICHAHEGGIMAYKHLIDIGWTADKAEKVKYCIQSHRYRGGQEHDTIEAKILFDADKLDVTGLIGVARTLIYLGQVSDPLYLLDEKGNVLDGKGDVGVNGGESFMHEYCFKLSKLNCKLYTSKAKEIVALWKSEAEKFYNSLLEQVNVINNYRANLDKILE